MNNNKYVDIACITNIIGNIYNNPKLLDMNDKYSFSEFDFPSEFHKIIFGSIYNIWQLGANKITLESIQDYLSSRPKKLAVYTSYKGPEYILQCAESASVDTFNYYYQRLKKMSLLRGYSSIGLDLSWFYDPDEILNSTKVQEQEDRFDNTSIQNIAELIDAKIDNIKMQCLDNFDGGNLKLGDHVDDILESLKETPALGYPTYIKYMDTITRGQRLGKFYLMSAPTGVGKSRSMIANACYLGCSQMYDTNQNKWIMTGSCQPTLYIATEQDETEVTTMALAFISGVDEEHILTNNYFTGEVDRVQKAAILLKTGKLYFTCIPDFGITDIQNNIKKHIREYGVEYVFFDYIHSSPKILIEMGGRSGIKNLREDNILFLLSSALKDIAVEYNIFIMSSTQLNASYMESDTPNESLLRGSKAIADRIDVGMIMMEVTQEDREKLQPFVTKNKITMPNLKVSVYKNRGNKYKAMYLWLNADRGACRFNGSFCTSWFYEYIDMIDLKISVEQEGAF